MGLSLYPMRFLRDFITSFIVCLMLKNLPKDRESIFQKVAPPRAPFWLLRKMQAHWPESSKGRRTSTKEKKKHLSLGKRLKETMKWHFSFKSLGINLPLLLLCGGGLLLPNKCSKSSFAAWGTLLLLSLAAKRNEQNNTLKRRDKILYNILPGNPVFSLFPMETGSILSQGWHMKNGKTSF